MFGFQRRFRICELFGIPVYLDLSTIFLALMFLQTGDIAFAVGVAFLLMVSIVLHELGHSLVARCFGCETRSIVLTVIGGCASLERMPRKGWQEFLVAAAGPMVSVLLGIGFGFAWVFLPEGKLITVIMYAASSINIGLALFNLLPGFPMDGGRIFRSAMRLFLSRPKATYVAMVVGRVAAAFLVFGPMLGVTHIWIIPIDGNIFLRVLIAVMIWTEGYREYQLALMESSWEYEDYRARVSPPPYGGDGDDVDVTRS